MAEWVLEFGEFTMIWMRNVVKRECDRGNTECGYVQTRGILVVMVWCDLMKLREWMNAEKHQMCGCLCYTRIKSLCVVVFLKRVARHWIQIIVERGPKSGNSMGSYQMTNDGADDKRVHGIMLPSVHCKQIIGLGERLPWWTCSGWKVDNLTFPFKSGRVSTIFITSLVNFSKLVALLDKKWGMTRYWRRDPWMLSALAWCFCMARLVKTNS